MAIVLESAFLADGELLVPRSHIVLHVQRIQVLAVVGSPMAAPLRVHERRAAIRVLVLEHGLIADVAFVELEVLVIQLVVRYHLDAVF